MKKKIRQRLYKIYGIKVPKSMQRSELKRFINLIEL